MGRHLLWDSRKCVVCKWLTAKWTKNQKSAAKSHFSSQMPSWLGGWDWGHSEDPRRTAACSACPAPAGSPASTGKFHNPISAFQSGDSRPGKFTLPRAPARRAAVGEGRGGEGARPAPHRPGSGSSGFAEWLPMFGRLRWPRAGRSRTEWLPCRSARLLGLVKRWRPLVRSSQRKSRAPSSSRRPESRSSRPRADPAPSSA